MRLDIDEKTGQLTVASAERAARILRSAATVERLLVVTGQLESTDSVAEALERDAKRLAECKRKETETDADH